MTIDVNNGQYKMVSGSKGKILEVGEFDPNGNPIGWTFSGEGEVAALEIGDKGRIIRWAGFSLAELRYVYDKKHKKDGE